MTTYIVIVLCELVGTYVLYQLITKLWNRIPSFNILDFLWGMGIRIAPSDGTPRSKGNLRLVKNRKRRPGDLN